MSLQIEQVDGRRDIDDFVKFPWRVYKGDSCWVPPLIGDMKKMRFSCQRHLYRTPSCTVQSWILPLSGFSQVRFVLIFVVGFPILGLIQILKFPLDIFHDLVLHRGHFLLKPRHALKRRNKHIETQ